MSIVIVFAFFSKTIEFITLNTVPVQEQGQILMKDKQEKLV